MRNLPNVDLARRHVGGVGGRRGIPGGGELCDGNAAVDAFAGLFEGEERAVDVLEGDEAVTLGFSSLLVENYYGFLEFSVGREEAAEAFGGGIPTQPTDEELALGRIGVGQRSDGVKDVHVTRGGVGNDVDEFALVDDAVHDLTHVFRCEFRDGGVHVRDGQTDAIFVKLSLLSKVHWNFFFKRRRRRMNKTLTLTLTLTRRVGRESATATATVRYTQLRPLLFHSIFIDFFFFFVASI